MSLGDWIAKNRFVAGVVAAIVLALAIVNLWGRLGGARRGPSQVYFYDLQAQQLFPGDLTELPPIVMPSGGQAVRAHVFGCGGCGNPDDRFVAYLEKYSDQAKIEMAKAEPNHDILTNGQVVSLPGDDRWMPLTSPAGAQILFAAQRKCEDAVECRP